MEKRKNLTRIKTSNFVDLHRYHRQKKFKQNGDVYIPRYTRIIARSMIYSMCYIKYNEEDEPDDSDEEKEKMEKLKSKRISISGLGFNISRHSRDKSNTNSRSRFISPRQSMSKKSMKNIRSREASKLSQ
jgi:hypothetical protein